MATNPYYQSTQWNQPAGYQMGQHQRQGADAQQAMIDPLGASPPTDIIDNEDELHLYLDLPGFSEDELEIRGDETTIVVNARRFGEVDDEGQVLLNERPTRFERVVPLPASVDVDEADVSYEQGVCKIVLPKAAPERYREIRFKTS